MQLIAEAKDLFMGLTVVAWYLSRIPKIKFSNCCQTKSFRRSNCFKNALGSLAMEAGKSAAKIPFIGPILAAAAVASIYALGKRYLLAKGAAACLFTWRKFTRLWSKNAFSTRRSNCIKWNKDTVIAGR